MERYLSKLKFTACCTTVCSVISVACLAAIPLLHKRLFDTAPGDWNISELMVLICLYAFAFVSCCVFEYFSQRTAWILDWKIHVMLRSDLYGAVFQKSYQEFTGTGIGEYLSKFQNDVDIVTAYINSGINSIKYILQIVVYFTFIITLDWRILTVIIIGTIVSLAVPKFTGKELSKRKNRWVKKQGSYFDVIKDLFTGFGENNYKTRENLREYHWKNLYETENSMLDFGRFSAYVHVVNGGVLYAINLLCFIIVGILYFTKNITSGTGVAALGYINSFIDPLRYLLEEISSMKASKGVVRELTEFIDSDSGKSYSRKRKKNINEIELIGVNKEFENFKLININASFKKGKRYAVIGPNGAGKSSLFKIISGIESPDSGKVLLDGFNIETYNITDMIFRMNSLSHIFNCDIKDNITVFNSYSISEKYSKLCERLCRTQQATTKEGKPATKLSTGEKQRITFLRAVIADFPVILFDEPFSAMDKENSRTLKNLLNDFQNKILITITHDLSEQNLKDFDVIIGMRDGRIVVKGAPDEIMNSEFYAESVK